MKQDGDIKQNEQNKVLSNKELCSDWKCLKISSTASKFYVLTEQGMILNLSDPAVFFYSFKQSQGLRGLEWLMNIPFRV